MAAVTGRVARIRNTSASATNSTNEPADLATDGLTLTINDTDKRHWDRNSTLPNVLIAGATATPVTDAFDVNYVTGTITFATAHSTSAVTTLDVDYLATSYLAGGKSWSVEVNQSPHDVTTFSTTVNDPVWRTYLAGLNDATISIERLFQSDTTAHVFWDTLNSESSNFIVELVVDDPGDRYEGLVRVASFSPSVEVDGVAEEGVAFQVDGELSYTTN